MQESYRGSSRILTPLAILTSPIILMGLMFVVSVFTLSVIQLNTSNKLRKLADEAKSLKEGNTKVLTAHELLNEAIIQLEDDVKFQKERLLKVDQFSRERNVILTGIPEQDGENLETKIRELLLKKISLSFNELEIEEVKRFGRKVTVTQGTNVFEARKVLVRFWHNQSKLKVMERSKRLNDMGYNLEADTRDLFSNNL